MRTWQEDLLERSLKLGLSKDRGHRGLRGKPQQEGRDVDEAWPRGSCRLVFKNRVAEPGFCCSWSLAAQPGPRSTHNLTKLAFPKAVHEPASKDQSFNFLIQLKRIT